MLQKERGKTPVKQDKANGKKKGEDLTLVPVSLRPLWGDPTLHPPIQCATHREGELEESVDDLDPEAEEAESGLRKGKKVESNFPLGGNYFPSSGYYIGIFKDLRSFRFSRRERGGVGQED